MVRVGLPIAALLMALNLLVFADRIAAADEDCPPLLTRQLAPHAVHTCRLLREGRLESGLGNSAVVYRLYRLTAAGEAPNPRYDAPPYNQVAVTLRLARRTADFWAAHYWLAMGWFEPPRIVLNDRYGELLVVPGRLAGSGALIEDRVFMATMAAGWHQIAAQQLNPETGRGWANELAQHLPRDHYIAKGIALDYATLTGATVVWRFRDPNCCPTGGRLRFRLELVGDDLRLTVAEARHIVGDTA